VTAPLAGTLVLDISRVIAGPACCMHLADLGAEVIRIEPPEGDEVRYLLPFSDEIPEGLLYTPFNKNKKSLALNIFAEQGRPVFLDLVKKADILVENYRSGVLAKAGLDYPVLRRVNPRLVYCSILGYSPNGPNSTRAGFDFAIQAETGVMSINGFPDGDPVKVGSAVLDLQAASSAAMCINAALLARERDGQGRRIEVTLFGAGITILAEQAYVYLLTGRVPTRLGNRGAVKEIVSDHFPTSDGGLVLTVPNQTKWLSLCEVAEFSHLKDDPRFNPIEQRRKNVLELIREIGRELRKKTTREWVDELGHKRGLVCAPVRSVDQALADPEVEALRMVRQIEHPDYGPIRVVGMPFDFPEDPLEVRLPPPPLGGHTREVLKDLLHMDDQRIEQLKADGIIA